LAPRIAAELLAEPAEQRPIHGDFSADQVLVAAHGIGIIDYDQTRLGDPAADFGTFIARLEHNEVCGALPAGRAGEIAEALSDGYCHQARCAQPTKRTYMSPQDCCGSRRMVSATAWRTGRPISRERAATSGAVFPRALPARAGRHANGGGRRFGA
jgi:hypothetical protein